MEPLPTLVWTSHARASAGAGKTLTLTLTLRTLTNARAIGTEPPRLIGVCVRVCPVEPTQVCCVPLTTSFSLSKGSNEGQLRWGEKTASKG